MVRVVIPSHSQGRSRTGQPFTMYSIQVYCNGRSHSVSRRYKDFHELHSDLKRSLDSVPDFPPKKLRNLSPRVIQERTLLLERYLQALLSQSVIHPSLQTFLGISSQVVSKPIDTLDFNQDFADQQLSHQTVIGFEEETASDSNTTEKDLVSNRDSILPDIVLKGALDALYSRHDLE